MASRDAAPISVPASDADPDWPLVRSLQGGDDGALDALMERHREGLFRFIYRYVENEATAADLVQETFVRAYFKIAQYRPQAKFVTWLYRLALNLCRDHARSAAARAAKRTEPLPAEGQSEGKFDDALRSTTPAQAAESSEEVARLHEAIQTLPHDLKTALILSALEQRPQQECAELLGTTPKAVETRVYRARKLLRAALRL